MKGNRVNKCIIPTHEEGDHLEYSQMCACKPIIVEYSRVRLYVHKELTPRQASDDEPKVDYLRSI